jgi:uncharacterized protein YndB with AHSA1/START domain
MVKENEWMGAGKTTGATAGAAGQMVFITRVFDAPPELVFSAWTDPAHLSQWYAPHGCTVHFNHIDVRPGGSFHLCIRNPKFHDCWCTGVYKEVSPPVKLVYTLAIADEKGNPVQPAEVGMDPAWPAETTVTVTFTKLQGKTKVTLHQTVSEALAKHTGAHPSWLQMLDRLAAQLAGAAAL